VRNAVRALAFAALVAAPCLQPPAAWAKTADAAAVRRHPLYGMLQQLDRQIAALRATLSAPGLDGFEAHAASDAREAESDLAAATAHASAFASTASADRKTENGAIATLKLGGDAGGVEAYRGALQQSATASLRSYGRGLDASTGRAYSRRAVQLAEAESTLAYQLETRDAAATMPLRIKLADLRPDADTRRTLKLRLATILGSESKAVASLHARDQASLAAYRSSLVSAARNELLAASADTQARTAANLRARSGVAAPAPGAALPNWPAYETADVQRTTDTAGAFEGARARISARTGDLIARDRESTKATLSQISALENERRALYREILSSSK
jgi:hypothetical protein